MFSVKEAVCVRGFIVEREVEPGWVVICRRWVAERDYRGAVVRCLKLWARLVECVDDYTKDGRYWGEGGV